MSSLRDMFVGINLDDNATSTLLNIDRLMDRVGNNFQRLGGNVDSSTSGFSSMNRQVSRVNRGLSVSTQSTSSLNQQIISSQSGMQQINRSVSTFGSTLRGLVGIVGAVFAVDKIKDFATSSIQLAASTKALSSQFEQVYSGMEDSATSSLKTIAKETGILPDRLKGSFVQMAAFAKTTGADTAQALSISERATLAAADSAAFYDKSIEEVADSMQSFLKGNFENDAALGISATETTRNAKANALYGKSFTKLSESQKQLTLLAMVEDGNKLSGALGQAARESDGFENVIGNLKGTWDSLKGTLAAPFLDSVTSGLQDLTAKLQGVDAAKLGNDLKSGFDTAMDVVVPTFHAVKDGMGWVIEHKDPLIAGLAGVTAGFVALNAISTVNGLMRAYQVSAFASTIATQGLNAALRANPIGLVVTAIGLLVAGGIALYQNWDTVKLKAGELWATSKEKFAGIKQSVSDFVQPAISWFDTIKQKWDGFKSSLTSFKMPGWVTSIGGAISGAAGKVKGLVNGSHATGLANVPFDNYRANLHKGESVLTAPQSDALRGLGVLGTNSDGTPTVNASPLVNSVAVATPTSNSGGNIQISAPIELIIQGNADDAAIQKLLSMLPAEVNRIFEEIFRRKLAGMGG